MRSIVNIGQSRHNFADCGGLGKQKKLFPAKALKNPLHLK
jgi:hypothetical protein